MMITEVDKVQILMSNDFDLVAPSEKGAFA